MSQRDRFRMFSITALMLMTSCMLTTIINGSYMSFLPTVLAIVVMHRILLGRKR